MPLPADIWVTEVSTSFPDAALRLLTGVPRNGRALELGEVRSENADVVANAIRDHPDIHEYDELFLGERRTIAQYEADEKSLYKFLWESSLPPEFPIVVENGAMEFDLTATQEQFDAFTMALEEQDNRYDLLSLVHTDQDEGILTERQREVVRKHAERSIPDAPVLFDFDFGHTDPIVPVPVEAFPYRERKPRRFGAHSARKTRIVSRLVGSQSNCAQPRPVNTAFQSRW
jgi:hypothetical protein